MWKQFTKLFSTSMQKRDEVRVVISATGKAANNVNGNTLHSLFHLPANHSFLSQTKLDQRTLN
jgi:hypothetical protein